MSALPDGMWCVKQRHRTKQQAEAQKVALLRRDRAPKERRLRPGGRLSVYLCGICDFWHVGHQPK